MIIMGSQFSKTKHTTGTRNFFKSLLRPALRLAIDWMVLKELLANSIPRILLDIKDTDQPKANRRIAPSIDNSKGPAS